MIRRPPRSTLFPTRRSPDLDLPHHFKGTHMSRFVEVLNEFGPELHVDNIHTRSEEHTSELQSRQYLVCRLLLEKKKKINDSAMWLEREIWKGNSLAVDASLR